MYGVREGSVLSPIFCVLCIGLDDICDSDTSNVVTLFSVRMIYC